MGSVFVKACGSVLKCTEGSVSNPLICLIDIMNCDEYIFNDEINILTQWMNSFFQLMSAEVLFA